MQERPFEGNLISQLKGGAGIWGQIALLTLPASCTAGEVIDHAANQPNHPGRLSSGRQNENLYSWTSQGKLLSQV